MSMNYMPPPGLRNAHVNTILASQGPRKWLARRRARLLGARSHEVLLPCSGNVWLHGEYAPGALPRKGLVILIHGWEGSAASTYMLSAAAHLFAKGYSVFRLHLRDHGPTHHLNREPFLATRLDEALDAVEQVQKMFPHSRNWLAGFSLGGNFAVRIAAFMHMRRIRLDRVVGICPLINPGVTAETIRRYPIYNYYFIRKWRRSFAKKMVHFPEHEDNADVMTANDLVSLHEGFVRRYTDHPNAASYFAAYALNARNLPGLNAPCHLILAKDDPVIPISTANELPDFAELTIEVTPHGGHCGFLNDYAMRSWADSRLEALFSA